MTRTLTGILLIALAIGSPALAQRIELDGSSANRLDVGPSDTGVERAAEGDLAVEVDQDGVAVDGSGSARLGVNERSETTGGSISLDTSGADEERPMPQAAPSEGRSVTQPGMAKTDQPLSQMRLPSDPFEASECLEADAFAEHRDAFMETEVTEASVYIRRVDVSVCGYAPSRELMTYLNTMPEIREGLDQMLIDPEQIVSADWTDDAGLFIYIVDPALNS